MRAYRAAIEEAGQQKPNGEERGPDELVETANHLIRIAIQALIRMRSVDWETATRCIKRAAAAAENKKPPLPSPLLPSRKWD